MYSEFKATDSYRFSAADDGDIDTYIYTHTIVGKIIWNTEKISRLKRKRRYLSGSGSHSEYHRDRTTNAISRAPESSYRIRRMDLNPQMTPAIVISPSLCRREFQRGSARRVHLTRGAMTSILIHVSQKCEEKSGITLCSTKRFAGH